MAFNLVIPLYMDDCRSRQLRSKTMLAYEQTLRVFSVWLEECYQIQHSEEIDDRHIRGYISDLQKRGKYTFCSVKSSERPMPEYRNFVKI